MRSFKSSLKPYIFLPLHSISFQQAKWRTGTQLYYVVVILALRHEWEEGQATALLIHLANRQGQTNGAHNEQLSQIDDVSEPTFHYFP